jgi:hypothetical protein
LPASKSFAPKLNAGMKTAATIRRNALISGAPHAAVFALEIFLDLFVIFVDMAVCVDNFGLLHE